MLDDKQNKSLRNNLKLKIVICTIILMTVIIGITTLYLSSIHDVYLVSVNTHAFDSLNAGKISLGYNDVQIIFYEKKGSQYYVLGIGTDNGFVFNMIPPLKNSLYVSIVTKGYFVDDLTTMKSNSDLQQCGWDDVIGNGNKYFICQIDTNSLDISFFKHYDFTAYLYEEKSK